MARRASRVDAYLEIGNKRTFAGAIEWPGWCRSGRDEAAALQALFDYAPRYAQAISSARLGFPPPADIMALAVVERLKGGATTDFGAPEAAPTADANAMNADTPKRYERLLKACWRTFDAAVDAGTGKELRKGPRGGGRELDKIVEHVLGADVVYLARLGVKLEIDRSAPAAKRLEQVRRAILQGLAAAVRGELPARGPRGGAHWTPRYFVRRSAWHVLDHAWEIEDRIEESASSTF